MLACSTIDEFNHRVQHVERASCQRLRYRPPRSHQPTLGYSGPCRANRSPLRRLSHASPPNHVWRAGPGKLTKAVSDALGSACAAIWLAVLNSDARSFRGFDCLIMRRVILNRHACANRIWYEPDIVSPISRWP
jgi:hypothetical protein